MNRAYKITFILLVFFQQIFTNQEIKLNVLPTDTPTILLSNRPSEGFIAGTMVQTKFGYKPIEEINFDDLLIGIYGDNEVLGINKMQTSHYVCICVENNYIDVAPYQQFYLQDSSVKNAQNLQAGDILYNNKYIYAVQIINDNEICYNISTSQHAFFIYPDLYVHNFDSTTITTANTLLIGAVEASIPVTILIGILVPLTVFAIDYFYSHNLCTDEMYDENLSDVDMALNNTEVIQKTRFYYEEKRKELCNLYQKLVNLKNSLVMVLKPNFFNTYNFLSDIKLNDIKLLPLINLSYEMQLTNCEKEKLFKIRTLELEKIEEDITDLHMLIAFHFNELLENRNFAEQALESMHKEINEMVKIYNINLENMPVNIVCSNYFKHFCWLETLEHLKIKTNEVNLVISYYNHQPNYFFINQTTNLYKIFNEQNKINDSIFQYIETNKKIAMSNMLINEDILRRYNLLTQQLIDKNKTIAKNSCLEKEKQSILLFKKRNETFKNTVKKLKEEKNKNSGGSPEKDPKDDDPLPENDKSLINHIFTKKVGHLPNTFENRKLLRELVKDSINRLGEDQKFHNDWYAKITKEGKQLWARVQNGKIKGGGLNETPLPWNPECGFRKTIK